MTEAGHEQYKEEGEEEDHHPYILALTRTPTAGATATATTVFLRHVLCLQINPRPLKPKLTVLAPELKRPEK